MVAKGLRGSDISHAVAEKKLNFYFIVCFFISFPVFCVNLLLQRPIWSMFEDFDELFLDQTSVIAFFLMCHS